MSHTAALARATTRSALSLPSTPSTLTSRYANPGNPMIKDASKTWNIIGHCTMA